MPSHEVDFEILGDDMQIVEVELDPEETVIAEAGMIDKSMVFGGEGIFLATLQGQGNVWLQSLPFSRLADRVLEHAPKAGGSRQGEGSVLGKFGNLFGD